MYPHILNCPTSKTSGTGAAFSRCLRLAVSTLPAMILLSTVLLLPKVVWAGKAELFIHPTLVELSNRQRSATVNIVNRGDAIGVFVIKWVDFAMTPEGGLATQDGVAPWSLQPHVRYSPRRVTLMPGETQLVKIALRRDTDVADGELYSHLKVLTLNNDVNSLVDGEVADSASLRRTVTIETRSAIAIPVIWRNSKSNPRATIESVKIDSDMSQVVVDVRRIGDLSTRGYLHVVRIGADGTHQALADPMPLVIYPMLERRVVTVPLKVDFGDADLGIHTEVVYSADLDLADGRQSLASYRITP